jgi:hypothetical protein
MSYNPCAAQAARLEAGRLRQLSSYVPSDNAPFGAAEWQTWQGAVLPLSDKPPFLVRPAMLVL